MTGPATPIPLKHCLIRFQAPRPGQSTTDARVTPPSFSPPGCPGCTPEAVAATINNFSNYFGTNTALWLWGTAWSMVYAGIDNGPFDQVVRPPGAQHGLDGDDVAVSIILPTGRAKLGIVTASPRDLPGMHAEVNGRLVGINIEDDSSPLVASDFAYTNAAQLTSLTRGWRTGGIKWGGGGFSVEHMGESLVFSIEEPYGGLAKRGR